MYTKILRNSHRRNDLEVTKRGGTHGYPVSARLGYSIRWKKEMKKKHQENIFKMCNMDSINSVGQFQNVQLDCRNSVGVLETWLWPWRNLDCKDSIMSCSVGGLAWPGLAVPMKKSGANTQHENRFLWDWVEAWTSRISCRWVTNRSCSKRSFSQAMNSINCTIPYQWTQFRQRKKQMAYPANNPARIWDFVLLPCEYSIHNGDLCMYYRGLVSGYPC